MKNLNDKIDDISFGSKVATQITDLMQTDSDGAALENYSELSKWLETDETSSNVTKKLSSPEIFSQLSKEFDRSERKSEKQRFIKSIEKKRKKERYFTILKLSSCAAALLILSFQLYISLTNKEVSITTNRVAQYSTPKININTIKPTLILDNGENIDLTVGEKIGSTIEKVSDNRLNYKNAKSEKIAYNTLIIPRQYMFDLILSDGTIVTLNANSKLRYPVEFKGDKREVFLEGEAYFHVKKGAQPFIVHAENSSIKVYGTQFNINSYCKEKIETTLIEGSIGVTIQNDTTVEIRMKPNQILTNDGKGIISIEEVDPLQSIGWMKGEITSYNEILPNLLDKISRWYGVEFVYSEKVRHIKISTSVNNDTDLNELLEGIKGATGVKITKINNDQYEVTE